ncbi:MAG: type 1 glutamine amidotransferase [Formivibrio sp.]|nr:type 1 glutamine amidotransferase [Formivibrio sp.]
MNPAKPLRIGLTARLMHKPPAELGFPGKRLQYIEQSIAHWVMRQGALAFMVPSIEAGDTLVRRDVSVRRYVEALDGLILQGGADVSPISYGETALRPEWEGDRVRDLYETELIWEFLIQGKPIMGICRGCQLINVAFGGSLYQDIATQLPDVQRHVDATLYDRLDHAITFAEDGWLQHIYQGLPQGWVNSIHHQSIRRLGNDLAIEALAEDGVVEAISKKGEGFLVGVQWHPEFHPVGSALLDGGPLLAAFLAAANKTRR